MAKAVWNGEVVAESDDIVHVENNAYFPMDSLKKEFFSETDTHTVCPWKGTASYFSIVIDGERNEDAAWYYPQTKELAKNLENRVAFWRGVVVTE